MQRLADRDPETSAHFATYFTELLYLKLRVRLRSAQLIEDVRQETLLRVLSRLRRGVQVESLPGFVNGVCNKVMMELCRKDGREDTLDENVEEPIDPLTLDPDAGLVNEDRKRAIGRVFEALGARDRRILQALYVDELSKEQVCKIFKVDSDYLRVLVHRAKKAFREEYLKEEPPPFNRAAG